MLNDIMAFFIRFVCPIPVVVLTLEQRWLSARFVAAALIVEEMSQRRDIEHLSRKVSHLEAGLSDPTRAQVRADILNAVNAHLTVLKAELSTALRSYAKTQAAVTTAMAKLDLYCDLMRERQEELEEHRRTTLCLAAQLA